MTVVSDDSTMVTAGNVETADYPYNAVYAWEAFNDPSDTEGKSFWDSHLNYDFSASGADWIWESYRVVHPIDGDIVCFEKTFDIGGRPTAGTLHITCDNGYEAYLNGDLVGSAQLGDGWEISNLTQSFVNTDGWQSVETYDVFSLLVSDGNVLFIKAANEYMGPKEQSNGTTDSNPAGLIFELDIDYEEIFTEELNIAIEKSGPASAHVGDTITYSYMVTSTSNVPLSAVTVSDNLGITVSYVSGDINEDDLLDLGETWIFTAEYVVPEGVDPVVNTATASGISPQETLVQAEDNWSVDIIHPAIEVEKSVDPTMTHSGDEVTYTIVVTNTGDCDLTVDVVDDVLGTIASDVSLAMGASVEYTPTDNPTEDVTNTVIATGTDAIGGEVSDSDSASVDVLHPEITVEKSADTEAAAPGEWVEYSYIVSNEGDCILYDVSLDDDVVGPITLDGLEDLDGEGDLGDLAIGASATGTADYEVTFDDPEWIVNTATAEGTDELELTVYGEDFCTVHTMGARTIGYWKNHPDAWCNFPSGSMFADKEQEVLLTYFPGLSAEEDGVNSLEMLRAQLIAAELNVACFDEKFDYSRYNDGAGIDGAIADAEAFLADLPEGALDDLNAYWLTLTKKQQNNVKEIANPLKDVLDTFNNMGDEIFE